MNKQQLIDAIQKDKTLGIETKAGASRVVEGVLNALARGVKKDKSVQLIGFGTFTVRTRKPRMGRNPKTGEEIKIKASKTVGFKPSKGLKDSL